MKIKHKTAKWIIGVLITAIIVVCLIFAVPGILKLAAYLIRLFLPFVLAYLFALLVDPLVRRLERSLKLPRKTAALLVIVLLIGVVGGAASWIVYKIVNEARNVYEHIPQIYESIVAEIDIVKSRLSGIYEILPANVQLALTELADQISDGAAGLINDKSVPIVVGAGSFAKALPKMLVSIIVFLLSSFFIVCDFERVKSFVKRLFCIKNARKLSDVSKEIKTYLGAYIKAQGSIMLVAFCILFLGFSILDVQYALIIAMGTAILDALPFFGSGAVLWPWAVISFITGDIKMALGSIIIYVVIQVTRQLIEPKIVSKNIGVSPILTLMSMYLGFRIFSIGGMIFGPLVMMLIISLYRAKVFETPAAFVKSGIGYTKKQFEYLKHKFINFWESE